MIKFRHNKITASLDTVGEILRQARAEQNLELSEIAQELNINLRYLEALESGEIDKLPAGIYGKNFLREYGEFLKIDTKELIKIYGQETKKEQNNRQKDLFSKKVPKARYFLTAPKIIKNIIIVIIILVCIGYLGIGFKKIFSPPFLEISFPAEDLVTDKNYINIQGTTDSKAEIIINDETVLIDPSGNFNKKINLRVGLNTILITAQKKYSRKQSEVRKIIVTE